MFRTIFQAAILLSAPSSQGLFEGRLASRGFSSAAMTTSSSCRRLNVLRPSSHIALISDVL